MFIAVYLYFIGPFVLTIANIIGRDIPYFLTFYTIILVAYSAALCALTMNFDISADYGFYIFFGGVYDLIQVTVNQGLPAESNFQSTNVSPSLLPLYDIVLTSFYVIIVIMFLNILIAMINNTYSEYQAYNETLLLMEKYNIMCGLDMSLFWLSKYHYRFIIFFTL